MSRRVPRRRHEQMIFVFVDVFELPLTEKKIRALTDSKYV